MEPQGSQTCTCFKSRPYSVMCSVRPTHRRRKRFTLLVGGGGEIKDRICIRILKGAMAKHRQFIDFENSAGGGGGRRGSRKGGG